MREYFISEAKYLDLDVVFPYNEMLEEAKNLRHKFTKHRDGDSEGWYGLVLHGLDENKTGSWDQYGITDHKEAYKIMSWTDASSSAPVTTDYFINTFPCKQYSRVRFMLLEAGGYINFHNDSKGPIIDNTSFVLNSPEGFEWRWQDGSPNLDMMPGHAYAMNIHYYHGLWNNSDEDRYFIIASRNDSLPGWKELILDAAKKQNVEGKFIKIDAMP
jgi:hypothetical protein|tara:strand:+ start:81 stop:725 length:645 start_codon:yes stop_codon:yes gene_type:complete